MLLLNWLQVNDFYSLNTHKNGIFSCLHDYISVSLCYNSDYIKRLEQWIVAVLPFLIMWMGKILKKYDTFCPN